MYALADEDNCRITCHLVGLEWFMYNRTPAYDVLATTLGLNPDATPLDPASKATATDQSTTGMGVWFAEGISTPEERDYLNDILDS